MKKLLALVILVPVLGLSQNDLSIDSTFHRMGVGGYYDAGLDYYSIPEAQFDEMHFSAFVSNVGTADMSGCYLRVQVFSGVSIVWSDSSATTDILMGASDSLFITTSWSSPVSPGSYDMHFEVLSADTDANLSNNEIITTIEVTNDILKRHNGIISDSLANIPENEGYPY